MLTIGVHHTLRIDRTTLVGLFLTDGTNDVLLPIKYVPKNFEMDHDLRTRPVPARASPDHEFD
jgi:hypothetical protein